MKSHCYTLVKVRFFICPKPPFVSLQHRTEAFHGGFIGITNGIVAQSIGW